MLYSGWTFSYVASLSSEQLQASLETYVRMKEEEIKTQAALLGVKKKGGKGRR